MKMSTEESRNVIVESEPRRGWSRLLNRPVQFALDLVMLALAFVLAYALRFEFVIPTEHVERMIVQLPLVLLLQFGCLQLFGVYSFVWRYVGMAELMAFAKAAWWSFLPILLIRLAEPEVFGEWMVPLSIIFFDISGGILR